MLRLGVETGDVDATRTITYVGGAAQASALVQMLEERGVHVEWRRPEEQRGFSADVEAVALSLMASGAYDGIKAAVTQFRAWAPHTKVIVEGEDEEEREPGPGPVAHRDDPG